MPSKTGHSKNAIVVCFRKSITDCMCENRQQSLPVRQLYTTLIDMAFATVHLRKPTFNVVRYPQTNYMYVQVFVLTANSFDLS